MLFVLVKISAKKFRNGYGYESVIMEHGASAKYIHHFGSEDEMLDIVNRILARQKKYRDVRLLLDQVRHDGYYFFDVNLTAKEAESLGWQLPSQLT
jgi:hypothetical protein